MQSYTYTPIRGRHQMKSYIFKVVFERDKWPDEPDENVIEAMLTADGDQTIVVWEERGMPLDLLSAYGAGVQIHVEDLADHLAGRERRDDAKARWDELQPAYQDLAAHLS